MATMAVDDDDDNISKLKAKIENLQVGFVYFQKENLAMLPPDKLRELQSVIRPRPVPTPATLIDLAGVKCYAHSDLGSFTHDLRQEHLVGRTLLGRFLRGKIDRDRKDVIIKTWDIKRFPFRGPEKLHPFRVYDEIMFMRNDFVKSHPNVPQLIGYSIDKVFAMVYDLPSMDIQSVNTLRGKLDSGNFDLDSRLNVAIQVANMMKDFHEMKIAVASIDPNNILVDQENNMKLCEFGLRDHMDKARSFVSFVLTAAAYTSYEGGLSTAEAGKPPTAESDIYAFGSLLLELFSKEAYESCGAGVSDYLNRQDLLTIWAAQQFEGGATSIVAKPLVDDEDVESEITELVEKCLKDAPDQRCDSKFVLEKMEIVSEKLRKLYSCRPSKKPKVKLKHEF